MQPSGVAMQLKQDMDQDDEGELVPEMNGWIKQEMVSSENEYSSNEEEEISNFQEDVTSFPESANPRFQELMEVSKAELIMKIFQQEEEIRELQDIRNGLQDNVQELSSTCQQLRDVTSQLVSVVTPLLAQSNPPSSSASSSSSNPCASSSSAASRLSNQLTITAVIPRPAATTTSPSVLPPLIDLTPEVSLTVPTASDSQAACSVLKSRPDLTISVPRAHRLRTNATATSSSPLPSSQSRQPNEMTIFAARPTTANSSHTRRSNAAPSPGRRVKSPIQPSSSAGATSLLSQPFPGVTAIRDDARNEGDATQQEVLTLEMTPKMEMDDGIVAESIPPLLKKGRFQDVNFLESNDLFLQNLLGEFNTNNTEKVSLAPGVILPRQVLDACLKQGTTASKLTRNLMASLFPDLHQLAGCCVMGMVSNVTKTARPALPKSKVNAIIKLVQKSYPQCKRSAIVLAMNMKCKEARKVLNKRTPRI